MMAKVKDLVKKPALDNKAVGTVVKDLISQTMKKGKVKSLKLKVKMGGKDGN